MAPTRVGALEGSLISQRPAGNVCPAVLRWREPDVERLCVLQQSVTLTRLGDNDDIVARQTRATPICYGTVTMILPSCSFDSRYRCASTIRSNGKTLAMTGFSLPPASPRVMNSSARFNRLESLVSSNSV